MRACVPTRACADVYALVAWQVGPYTAAYRLGRQRQPSAPATAERQSRPPEHKAPPDRQVRFADENSGPVDMAAPG
eukprot:COSAG01_NODE_1185_length_11350_cov_57.861781_10_plen_76_part_00